MDFPPNGPAPILIEPPERRWECPNCTQVALTFEAVPQPRFHCCSGLRGLTAPMVLAGSDVKVEAVVREDYVGNEIVTTDAEGTPVMAIVTTRADGSNDCAVMAPCATTATE